MTDDLSRLSLFRKRKYLVFGKGYMAHVPKLKI